MSFIKRLYPASYGLAAKSEKQLELLLPEYDVMIQTDDVISPRQLLTSSPTACAMPGRKLPSPWKKRRNCIFNHI